MAIDCAGKVFSSRPKEPTREQIKEAFKKTIERWEKIVEDVDYFRQSSCPLCRLFRPGDQNCTPDLCPIAIYANTSTCRNTPYIDFCHNNTPANALAELNFLRKVYIWWIEEEGKGEPLVDYLRKKEKKEEWEDVTERIDWHIGNSGGGSPKYFCIVGADPKRKSEHMKNVFFVKGIKFNWGGETEYKIEESTTGLPGFFRILKKI